MTCRACGSTRDSFPRSQDRVAFVCRDRVLVIEYVPPGARAFVARMLVAEQHRQTDVHCLDRLLLRAVMHPLPEQMRQVLRNCTERAVRQLCHRTRGLLRESFRPTARTLLKLLPPLLFVVGLTLPPLSLSVRVKDLFPATFLFRGMPLLTGKGVGALRIALTIFP